MGRWGLGNIKRPSIGGMKPGPGSDIDWSNEVTNKLNLAWLFNEGNTNTNNTNDIGPKELIHKLSSSFAAGGHWGYGTRGIALVNAASSSDIRILSNSSDVDTYIPTTQVTLVIGITEYETALPINAIFGLGSGASSASTQCSVFWAPGGNNTLAFDFAGNSEGSTQLTTPTFTSLPVSLGNGKYNIYVFSAGPRGMEIWINGKRIATNTGTSFSRTLASGAPFCLGRNSSTTGHNAAYDFLYIWNRQLNYDECLEISQQPFSIILPQERYSIFRGMMIVVPNVNDTLALTDDVSFAFNPLLINVNDSITLTDLLTQINFNPSIVSVNDSTTLSEFVTFDFSPKQISINDITTLTDQVIVQTFIIINVNDTLVLTEIGFPSFRFITLSIAENIILTDSFVVIVNPLRPSVNDFITITDFVDYLLPLAGLDNTVIALRVFTDSILHSTTILSTTFQSYIEHTVNFKESINGLGVEHKVIVSDSKLRALSLKDIQKPFVTATRS